MAYLLFNILQALGIALINSFWQMALLWLLVISYLQVHPLAKTRVASLLSFFALLAGFICFIFTFWYSMAHANAVVPVIGAGYSYPVLHYVLLVAGAAYVLLLSVPIIKVGYEYRQLIFLRNSGWQRVPGHFKLFTADGAAHLGISQKVRICISALVTTPLTIGFYKPLILLPTAILNQLTVEQTEAVIMHELAHIKNNDYLFNFLSRIMLAFLYFNPFAKALVHMQDIEREKAADDWVMQFEYDKSNYAAALLAIAKNNSINFAIQAAHPFSLLYRVQSIMGDASRTMPHTRKIIRSILTMLLLFVISLLARYSTAVQPSAGDTNSVHLHQKITHPNIEGKQPILQAVAFVQPVVHPAKAAAPVAAVTKMKIEPTAQQASEALLTAAATPSVIHFAAAPVVPLLSPEKEKNIQEALVASKKIIEETYWKEIELAIAETMTDAQKELLKQQYMQLMNTKAQWNSIENRMRLHYDATRWEKLNAALSRAANFLRVDSLYQHYTANLAQLESLKKHIQHQDSVSAKSMVGNIKNIDTQITQTQALLRTIDTLRSKKIVDL